MDRILALSPIPSVLLDPSLHITEVSGSCLQFFDVKLEDCKGEDFYDFVQKILTHLEIAPLRDDLQSAISTKNAYKSIAITEHTCWSIRFLPIFENDSLIRLVVEFEDITEERSKTQALNDQLDANETYRVLVDTVKDYAIFMLDTECKVATWNAGAAILKGYSPQEIIGRHFSVFYSQDDRAAKKPEIEIEACLRDGKVEDEGWRYRKDGSRFWANVVITAVYRSDEHIGFSKVTRDLTERKAAEDRLIAAYEEADKLKSAFLANMSHEIRTPMHGMLSANTLLFDTGLSNEQRELAEIIDRSGSILLQVINDILDYSKLKSGSFPIRLGILNVEEIVTVVVRSFQTVRHGTVIMEKVIAPNIPSRAMGDQFRYSQIIQNLISNAIKFTETGNIFTRVVLVDEDDKSYTILTEVIDTGIGVSSEAVDSLFKPFTQIDVSATKKYKGTGLGLSICKSLCEIMGGEIGFRPNTDPHGSVFWFTVKLGKLEPQDEKPLEKPLPIRTISNKIQIETGKRILLAEDNPLNQKVMLKLLKSLGLEAVDIAANGADAVELVQQSPERYAMILMDISMPKMDGVSATVEIRRLGLSLPIVALTANALKGDAEAYLAKGMDDYISKPVDRHILSEILVRWLDRKEILQRLNLGDNFVIY